MKTENKIEVAIEVLISGGLNDSKCHKQWAIDQVLRILTECPIVKKQAIDWRGKPYTFDAYGESEQYEKIIDDLAEDDYSWEIGMAP